MFLTSSDLGTFSFQRMKSWHTDYSSPKVRLHQFWLHYTISVFKLRAHMGQKYRLMNRQTRSIIRPASLTKLNYLTLLQYIQYHAIQHNTIQSAPFKIFQLVFVRTSSNFHQIW